MSKMNNNGKNNKHNRRTATQSGRNGGRRTSESGEIKSQFGSEDTRYSTKGSNDPSWYGTDPNLLRDAANIAFAYPAGRPIDLGVQTGTMHFKREVAGICALELVPTVGFSHDPHSPINVASMSMYTFVRKNKAGNLPFDAPDLMCYALAMSDVYSYINYLQRLYGLASLYTQQNQFVPRGLVKANYADFDDLITNLADFRYGINVLINKAASLAAPSNLTLFQRRAFLYQNVYTEGNSIKDQLYMFVPYAFITYKDGTDTGSGTRLAYKSFANKTRTVKELLEYGTQLISSVINDADAQTMSAFILEAYGPNGILKLQAMPESYAITPIFDIGVLEQFQNAVPIPTEGQNGALLQTIGIHQDIDKAYLESWPQVSLTNNYEAIYNVWSASKVLTTQSSSPDASIVMESSRLMTNPTTVASTETAGKYHINCGTEIPFRVSYWTMCYYAEEEFTELEHYVMGSVQVVDLASEAHSVHLHEIAAFQQFKYHPEHIYVGIDGGIVSIDYMSNLDNFAVITPNDMARLHEAALLNELNVPKVGKLS